MRTFASSKRVAVLAIAALLAGTGLLHPVWADPTPPAPATKACVGNPPRQTEDPESPPCIPFFSGDNGGATAPGVSGDEIRVVLRLDGGYTANYFDGSVESIPRNTLYDLDETASADEPGPILAARSFRRWFSNRYQTYGRNIHMWAFTSDRGDELTPQFDAEAILTETDPFVVIDTTTEGRHDTFARLIAEAGRIVVSDSAALPAALTRSFPGLIWSTQPSDEQMANTFASFLCSQGHPANTTAFVRNVDDSFAGLVNQGSLTLDAYSSCLGDPAVELTIGAHEIAYDTSTTVGVSNVQTMQNLRSAGVDQIVVAGGYNSDYAHAAALIGYRPQWVVAGDGVSESISGGRYQAEGQSFKAVAANLDPSAWPDRFCTLALAEVGSSLSPAQRSRSCHLYDGLRVAFNGIQVAGPSLTSASFDSGLHAVPVHQGSRTSPACYYVSGDYSCVKDVAIADWSDLDTPPADPGTASAPGCWKVAADGKRSRAGEWNRPTTAALGDPCSSYTNSVRLNLT